MFDYFIVGDGIAGLFLYHFLNERRKKVLLIGQQDSAAASTASTGLINPITGRKFILTWMAAELLEFSEQFYSSLEDHLNTRFFEKRNIFREFEDARSQNNWMSRSAEPLYSSYYNPSPELLNSNLFKEPKSGMEVNHAFWVNAAQLSNAYRKKIENQNDYLRQSFEHDDLEIKSDRVAWKGKEAAAIIFAEGYGVHKNPWFKDLPFQYALGYSLIIKCEELMLDRIVKKRGIFIIPLGEMRYQIGSTFIRNQMTISEDDHSVVELTEKLESILRVPFTVLSHSAGVRTVVRDRRPILGSSAELGSIYIFNGLGTKGYSLAPYFASHFVDYLIEKKPLMDEVNINRFYD